MRKTKRNVALVLLACLVLVASLSFKGIYAKYKTEYTGDKTVTSPEFYFNTNLNEPHYDLNSGTTSFSFRVMNYEDDLRYSDDKINYTVKVTPAATVHADTTELEGGGKNSATVTLSGLQPGTEYTVAVTGSAGFSQTHTFTLKVAPSLPAIRMNTDAVSDPSLVKLTVQAENLQGAVTIKVPEGLILHDAYLALNNYNFGTEKYEEAVLEDTRNFTNGNHSYTYIFIKTSDYSGEVPFEVTINDGSNTYTAVEAPLN